MKHATKLMMKLAAVAALLTAAAPAGATVSLNLADGDSTPTSVIVNPGATFTVTASLITTSEKVTGADYYLTLPAAVAGKFRLTARNAAGSSLSDLVKSDTGDNASSPGILDANFSLIATQPGVAAPRNALDLGASIANVNSPLNAGTYILATYTLSVAADTPVGAYTLATTSDAGTGWVGIAPLFPESAFSAQGAFTINVQAVATAPTPVPEPATVSLLVLTAIATLGRRRHA